MTDNGEEIDLRTEDGRCPTTSLDEWRTCVYYRRHIRDHIHYQREGCFYHAFGKCRRSVPPRLNLKAHLLAKSTIKVLRVLAVMFCAMGVISAIYGADYWRWSSAMFACMFMVAELKIFCVHLALDMFENNIMENKTMKEEVTQ